MISEKERRRYEIRRRIKDVFYPNRCPICGELIAPNRYICSECRIAFPYVYGVRRRFGIRIYSVCRYRDVKNLVLSAKNDRNGVMLSFMASSINELICRHKLCETPFDIIVPIPMHILSRIARGYSQTEMICRELSDISGISCCKALVKRKHTKQQKMMSGRARLTNLKGAFALAKNIDIKGKRILLVDDVSTTGSTFIRAVRELKKGGCGEITAVCFADAGSSKND